MKWSFCIPFIRTQYLEKFINSIVNQEEITTNDYQIILVGQEPGIINDLIKKYQKNKVNIIHIPFDENIKKGWITKKKNVAVRASMYENLVISHDYFALCEGWYKEFKKFGNDWDVCMNQIRLLDNRRFRDWCYPRQWWGDWDWLKYDDNSMINKMYISGSYWCAKKSFMLSNPLDENRVWGQGEDCEWSDRCKSKWNYKMNKNSVVKVLKKENFIEHDHPPEPLVDPEMHLKNNNYTIQE